MAALEAQFKQWRAARGEAVTPVEFVRVEDESLVLAFLRLGGSRAATVSLAAVEGAGFFLEGLEDPPDEVEDWLTDLNGDFSEKPSLTLGQAVEAMLARAPKRLKLDAAAAGGAASPDSPMGGEDDDDEMESEEEVLRLDDIEAAEDRSAQRAAQAEDEKWDSFAASSAAAGSRQASQVLMREMRKLMSLDGDGSTKALEIDMVGDSLYRWSVKMHANGFPEDCALRRELLRFGSEHASGLAAIVMDVHFPDSYPMSPPFIRVVRPRFQFHTGHVTLGGSVCMQLLTQSGWLPSVALETVFVAIRSEMVEGGGKLDFANKKDYTLQEAREAFNRVAERYGWKR